MASKKYYVSCPYCGNSENFQAVYTKIVSHQFYDWNGNSCGYYTGDDVFSETKSVYCAVCHRRITTLDRLEAQGKERGLYDG